MTNEIQELSEKLAQMYGVDAYTSVFVEETNTRSAHFIDTYLAKDSGRISDLADDVGVNVRHIKDFSTEEYFAVQATHYIGVEIDEDYENYPTPHDAARMARARCLLAIGEK